MENSLTMNGTTTTNKNTEKEEEEENLDTHNCIKLITTRNVNAIRTSENKTYNNISIDTLIYGSFPK